MPDISGFTKFVNETEIIHGQHIVQELLDVILAKTKITATERKRLTEIDTALEALPAFSSRLAVKAEELFKQAAELLAEKAPAKKASKVKQPSARK